MHAQLGQIMNNKIQKDYRTAVASEVLGARSLHLQGGRQTT